MEGALLLRFFCINMEMPARGARAIRNAAIVDGVGD